MDAGGQTFYAISSSDDRGLAEFRRTLSAARERNDGPHVDCTIDLRYWERGALSPGDVPHFVAVSGTIQAIVEARGSDQSLDDWLGPHRTAALRQIRGRIPDVISMLVHILQSPAAHASLTSKCDEAGKRMSTLLLASNWSLAKVELDAHRTCQLLD